MISSGWHVLHDPKNNSKKKQGCCKPKNTGTNPIVTIQIVIPKRYIYLIGYGDYKVNGKRWNNQWIKYNGNTQSFYTLDNKIYGTFTLQRSRKQWNWFLVCQCAYDCWRTGIWLLAFVQRGQSNRLVADFRTRSFCSSLRYQYPSVFDAILSFWEKAAEIPLH